MAISTISSPNAIGAGAVNQAALATGVVGKGPAFMAFPSANQSISAGAYQLAACDTSSGSYAYDTNGCYNNTGSTVTLNGLSVPSYAFCPNVAGYYMVSTNLELDTTSSMGVPFVNAISKNGVNLVNNYTYNGTAVLGMSNNTIVYLNGTGDYLRLYAYVGSGSGLRILGGYNAVTTFFSACLIRSA